MPPPTLRGDEVNASMPYDAAPYPQDRGVAIDGVYSVCDSMGVDVVTSDMSGGAGEPPARGGLPDVGIMVRTMVLSTRCRRGLRLGKKYWLLGTHGLMRLHLRCVWSGGLEFRSVGSIGKRSQSGESTAVACRLVYIRR